jgi:hypothetical protein
MVGKLYTPTSPAYFLSVTKFTNFLIREVGWAKYVDLISAYIHIGPNQGHVSLRNPESEVMRTSTQNRSTNFQAQPASLKIFKEILHTVINIVFMWQYERSLHNIKLQQYKLRGLDPRVNYTDRATAACRRS